jgi:NSS family neurotransmitter:Na+ symporter
LGGICIAIFAGWVIDKKVTEKQLALPHQDYYDAWRFLVKYISPAAVIIVFLNVVGIL